MSREFDSVARGNPPNARCSFRGKSRRDAGAMVEGPNVVYVYGTGRHAMNFFLWVLQVLAALLYGVSGVMKVFMFDKVSEDVPSFDALPREAGWPWASSNSSVRSG
jgi:hypothetical protein